MRQRALASGAAITEPAQPLRSDPPGPPRRWLGLPLLFALAADRLTMIQRLKDDYGDVVRLRILRKTLYWLFDPEMVRQVLVDHDADFVKQERQRDVFRQVQGDNLLTTEGEVWKRQRRILTPAFVPRKIAGYLALMAQASADGFAAHLPRAVGQSALVDVDRFTTRLTMDVILRALFGRAAEPRESASAAAAIRALSQAGIRELFWPVSPPAWLPYPGRAAKRAHNQMLNDLVAREIAQRRRAVAGQGDDGAPRDLLSMMLAARDEDPAGGAAHLDIEEVHANCMVIFLAGHDTSATALTWWLGLMGRHPEYRARVRAEIAGLPADAVPGPEALMRLPWLNATLKEAMRLYPPAAGTFQRQALRDVVIGGERIARDTIIGLPIWHLHHDPRWFPEPERFRPERFLPGAPEFPRGAYMPFGAGPHVCIGQHFAMIEMALIAALLLRDFDVVLAPGAELPKPALEIVLKPDAPLHLRFTRIAQP